MDSWFCNARIKAVTLTASQIELDDDDGFAEPDAAEAEPVVKDVSEEEPEPPRPEGGRPKLQRIK